MVLSGRPSSARRVVFYLTIAFVAEAMGAARSVLIDNVHPRLDTAGRIVNAHDGSLLLDPQSGRFYLYGTHYQACPLVPPPPSPGDCANRSCGWEGNTFAAYSSDTLESGSWRLESTSIAPGMEANNTQNWYFMPNVLYCAETARYVLAYNVPDAFIEVAVSASPAGPFTIIGEMPLAHGIQSQFDLWLDPLTGLAYARYNAAPGQCLEELTPDFLAGTGKVNCIDVGGFLEGGGVFRRGDKVYVSGGHGCCFCPTGAGSQTYMSSTGPLGNFSYIGDANPSAPCNVSEVPRRVTAIAAAAPPPSCDDLSGEWVGVFLPSCATPSSPTIRVQMGAGGAFTASDAQWDRDGNGTLLNSAISFEGHWGGSTSYVQGTLGAASGGPPCTEIRWTSPGHESERWCRAGFCQGGGLAIVAQQFQVFVIAQADGSEAYIYFGERWASSPTGLKSDDFSAWAPLQFDASGGIIPFTHLVANFTLLLP